MTSQFLLPGDLGVGLKPEHFTEILQNPAPSLSFFEIHAENYLVDGGPFHHYLNLIRQDYKLSVHGVGMSLGGEDSLNIDHLKAVKMLVDRYQPAVFSEHLAWSGHRNIFFNDLLPVAYNSTSLQAVCRHIDQVQTFLKRPILLENPSTYVEFIDSAMPEAEFIKEIIQRTQCGLLLDLNNVYVSCMNHSWDIPNYLRSLPLGAIQEIHLAGFTRENDENGDQILIDSHKGAVDQAVWHLFEEFIASRGPIPTLIEWDSEVPSFQRLTAEAEAAAIILAKYPVTTINDCRDFAND